MTALPKAHLHLHFTGSMRVETVRDLAEKHGLHLPDALTTGYPPQLSARDERGWFRFQRLYDAARACVRDESDLRRIVREAAQDDAAEGSRWLEIQVDPTSYAPFVGGITPALEIVLDEAAAASREGSTQVAVVVAASRIRHPLDARTLARLAAQHAGEGPGTVVGFGLSNDERRGQTSEFAPAFEIARRAGLALVPHAGELLGPTAVEATLEAIRPDRIGHGVRSVEDPRVLDARRRVGSRPGGLPPQQRRPRGLRQRRRGAAAHDRASTAYPWRWEPTTRCCSARGSPTSTSWPAPPSASPTRSWPTWPGGRCGRRGRRRRRARRRPGRHRRLAAPRPTDRCACRLAAR